MRVSLLIAILSTLCFADTVTLKNGTSVEGTYLGGDSRTVRIAVGDKVMTYDVSGISTLSFGGPAAASAVSSGTTTATSSSSSTASAAASAADSSQMIPSGSSVVIRLIDDVDSERDMVGTTFRASLDESLMSDGRVVIPRGADVVVKLVEDKQAGRLTGRTELTLDIESLKHDGKTYEIATAEVTQQSGSRTTQTAKRAGGLAALGAIIGGVAGGGKGAAIGAAAGGATGAGIQVLTKGPKVRIPSETRLTFTLQQPIRL
jgi:hypothetical protein